jgi:3-keto-disaccharide hydrolase
MKRSVSFLEVVCDPSARRSALTLQESGKTDFSGLGFVRESPPDETGVIPRYIGDGGPAMRSFVSFFTVLVILGPGARAQTPPESGWLALFNGKDLTGWKNNGAEKWVVEQGTIRCESAANKYGYLTTEKTYRDFTLRLKFKGEAAGNSGVFLHARITGIDPEHGPDIEGMQVEVDPSIGKHTGGLYESGGRGWVMMPTVEGEQALRPGEWNDLEVSVQGHHIVTRLNGVKIVDFTDAAPKFADGVIALQIHTGGGVRMRWKDIFIKEK